MRSTGKRSVAPAVMWSGQAVRPALPPLAGADDVAAAFDVDDASTTSSSPRELRKGGCASPRRPLRDDQFGAQTSPRSQRIACACASSIATCGASSSTSQAHRPTVPSALHQRVAAASASLQGAVSRHVGLEGPHPPVVPKTTALPRLGYTHEIPPPARPPFVAPAYSAAAANGAAAGAPLGSDMWSSRTIRDRDRDLAAIIDGDTSIVMSEVETLLSECGITAGALACSLIVSCKHILPPPPPLSPYPPYTSPARRPRMLTP